MAAGTIEQPTQPHPARRLALDPYVMRVRSWCLENEKIGRQGPIQLRLGYQQLRFDPPSFMMILRSLKPGEDPSNTAGSLPLEILAWLTKSLEDLAKLRSAADPTSRAVFALQAELMLDSALGTALLAEVQPRIDELELFDEKKQAQTLGKLKDLVRKSIFDISASISDSERQRASDLAGTLTDRSLARAPVQTPTTAPKSPQQPVRAEPVRQSQPEPIESTPTKIAVTPGKASREFSSTLFLGVGLFLAVVIWIGLFGLAGLRETGVKPLTLADFDGVSVLSGVEARPPSMFVQVDRDRWRNLDDAGRVAVVERVTPVLSRNGYSGALFETGEGRPVAQWLRDRGSQLIGETAAEQPDALPVSPPLP